MNNISKFLFYNFEDTNIQYPKKVSIHYDLFSLNRHNFVIFVQKAIYLT